MRRFVFASLVALASAPALAADSSHPTVIELFQSQGCSSCPPANASLIEFVKRPDVLALNFSVDYWDRLGWKDTFDSPAYTARQYAYARSLGDSGVYTPEIIVNGRAEGVGESVSEMESLAQRADRGSGGPSLSFSGGSVTVGQGRAPSGGAEVWLALYDPNIAEVAVPRGENAGRTLAHTHIVHGLQRLGVWSGAEARFALPSYGGWSKAVLVQTAGVGPILSAAKQ